MKKVIVILMILTVFPVVTFSQQKDTVAVVNENNDTTTVVSDDEQGVTINMDEVVKEGKRDTTKIKLGDKDINIIEDDEGTSVQIRDADKNKSEEKKTGNRKKFKGHWTGFELGLNNFVDADFSMSRPPAESWMDLNTGKSWNVNFNVHQKSFGLIGNRFGLVTGVGLEFNNYQFDGYNSIEKDIDGITVSRDLSALAPDKSKLTVTYLNIPLLVEVQIGPEKRRKRMYLSGGVIGGLKLGSHTKYVYRDEGKREKVKNRDDFNINALRYGLTLRAGYGGASVYAVYYPVSFFEKNKGPELYPVSIGLAFGF